MNEDERFVREHWEDVTVEWGRIEGKLYGMATSQSRPIYLHGYKTEAEIWSSARRFTEERLEQIRQAEKDVRRVMKFVAQCRGYLIERIDPRHDTEALASWSRILAREQAALDELKRGMKQLAAQTATE